MIIVSCLLLLLKEAKPTTLMANNYETFTSLTTDILKHRPTSIVLFSCKNNVDNMKLLKLWSLNGFQVSIQHINTKYYKHEALKTAYGQLNVLLDLECEDSNKTVTWASEQKLFTKLHNWILHYQTKEKIILLEHLTIPLDSQVTAMQVGNETAVLDVYQLTDEGPVKYIPYVSPELPLQSPPRRHDYGGMTIKSVIVVLDDVFDKHFLDVTSKHHYHLANLEYELAIYISQILNFRMQPILTDNWGYPANGTMNYTGLVGFLQRGEAEFGVSAILMKIPRMKFVDYAGVPFTFGGSFMFLKPALSEIKIIYPLPFDTSVWLATIGMTIILVIVLYLINRVEKKCFPLTKDEQFSLNEAISLTFGVTCQQGAYFSPKSITAKMVFALFLLLGMFIYISYSAKIVSLLQISSDSVNSLESLTDSPFTVSMRNASYYVNYEHESTSVQIKKLYNKKIYSQSPYEAFTSQEVGIAKVQRGLHAFLGDPDTYQMVSDALEEHEKCRYSEIKLVSAQQLFYTLRKGSHFHDHIIQKVNWMRETGIIYRTYRRWLLLKPKCDSSSDFFVSVRIEDFYPTLVILGCGASLAIVLLFSEIVWKKFYYN